MKFSDYKAGQWSAKAVVEDLRTGQRAVLDLQIIAERDQRLRVSIASFEGMALGQFVWQSGQMRLVLHPQRQFFSGQGTPAALKSYWPASFDLNWMHNILFDIPINGSNWSCESDASGFIQSCQDLMRSVFIRWKNRRDRRKQVDIAHPDFSVRLSFESFSGRDKWSDQAFGLEIPPRYTPVPGAK